LSLAIAFEPAHDVNTDSWVCGHSKEDDRVDQSLASTFADRLVRLRSKDDAEIEQFVAKYEPFIRRTLRFRIARSSLSPAADSVDVCQSVLFGFLTRLSAGEYELHCEEDLRKLLAAIANKKFLRLNRHEMAAKRCRAQTQSLSDLPELAASSASFSGGSAGNSTVSRLNTTDLFEQLSLRMSAHEMELYRLRSQGNNWATIGEQLGETPSILRKRLSRAIQRVAAELGRDANED